MGGGWDFFNLYENFFTCVDDFFNIIPCTNFFLFQLIIFPIEKSLHEFFFSNFFGARIFFLTVSPARFLFLSPPPHHFSNDPPLRGNGSHISTSLSFGLWLSYWRRSELTVRKHFEINKHGVFAKRNKYIMNDDIVHDNFYFKKKLLLAWLEFEIVINTRVCKVVLH